MSKNFQQDGVTLDWTNITGKAVSSGDAVEVGGIVGVAHEDIAKGNAGVLHTTGVWVLPKANVAITAGQKLYLEDGELTTTESTALAGTAWADAAVDEPEVPVRLGF